MILLVLCVTMANPRDDLEKVLSEQQPKLEQPSDAKLEKQPSSIPVDPKIIDGPIRVSGPVTKKEVRRTLQTAEAALRECYRSNDPGAPVVISVVIETTSGGAPKQITFDRKLVPSEHLADCLMLQLSTLRFPAKDAPSKIQLRFKFTRSAAPRE